MPANVSAPPGRVPSQCEVARRLGDGPIDRLQLAGEMGDGRRGERGRGFVAEAAANSSHSRRIAGDGGAQGSGMNISAYSRIRAASTLSVLFRPSLVRAKSRICAGFTTLTTWPASCNANARPRL